MTPARTSETSTSIHPAPAADGSFDGARSVRPAADDLTIIGAGLLAARHLGQAAVEVLRTARVVFCSDYNSGMAEQVRALNPRATIRSSEENEYQLGMYRPDMYRRMAS